MQKQIEERPTLILLHGFLGSGRSFDFLTPFLKPAVNVITIDLLGHGRTGGAFTARRFSKKEQLQDLHRLLPQLTADKPYLYGYSMGGRLALRYALEYPKRLRGLILESTHEGIISKKDRQERQKLDQRWAGQIRSDYRDFLNGWHQLELFHSSTRLSDQRRERYRKIQYNQRPHQMALSLEGFGQGSVAPVHESLSSLTTPTLLGAGNEDPKYVDRMKKMDHEMPQAELSVIEGAAHRIHLDQPARWSKVIKNFIFNPDTH